MFKQSSNLILTRHFTLALIDMSFARIFFTNAQKIYHHLRVSIVRFLITFTGDLDILYYNCISLSKP